MCRRHFAGGVINPLIRPSSTFGRGFLSTRGGGLTRISRKTSEIVEIESGKGRICYCLFLRLGPCGVSSIVGGYKYYYQCPTCGTPFELKMRVTLTKRRCSYCGTPIVPQEIDRQAEERRQQAEE